MAMRQIDLTGLAPADIKVSGAPEISMVAVADLIIDDRYQRAIERRGHRNIEKIAANFDWAKFSPLMVSRRDGDRFAIIDGQHRAHAAALCGIDHVPAMISTLTLAEEASAFSWINGTVTALTSIQVFRAALAAFEPWAVQCDAVVAKAGARLMSYNKSAGTKKPGEVFCVTLVRRFVEAGQSQALATVLRGVLDSHVGSDVRYVNGFGLSALVPAVLAAGVTQSSAVTAFLNDHDLDDVARRVDRIRELPENRGKSFTPMFAASVTVMLKAHAAGKMS